MKNVWGLLIVLSIVGVGVALVLTIDSAVDTVVTKIDEQSDIDWEYQLVYTFRDDDTVGSLSDTANELGSDGWEYVGYFMNNGTNARVTLFKRPAE